MSGRIRTFKPELLDHDRYAELTDAATRLFQGAVLNADDRGNCPAGASWIAGRIFHGRPKNKIQIGKLLHELEAARLIDLYKVDGASYMAIVGWSQKGSPTYQRIDKPQPPKYPLPTAVRSWNAFADGSESESESETRGSETKGTENERERDARTRTSRSPDPSPAPADAPDPDQEADDQEAERERAPDAIPEALAEPDPSPGRAAVVQRVTAAAWQLGREAFRKLGNRGIDTSAPDTWTATPPAGSPPMRALKGLAEQQLDQHRIEEAALAVFKRRVDVALAEGVQKRTRQWMTPMHMWSERSFAIASEMSPQQFGAEEPPRRPDPPLVHFKPVAPEDRAGPAELHEAFRALGYPEGDQL